MLCISSCAGMQEIVSDRPFSKQGSVLFNRRLSVGLKDFTRDLLLCFGDALLGISLGGSYGRGEGLVGAAIKDKGSGIWSFGEIPLEDLDLLIFLKEPAYSLELFAQLREKYEQILSLPIDILGVLTPSQFKALPFELSWHEMSQDHIVLWGDTVLLEELLQEKNFKTFPESACGADLSGWYEMRLFKAAFRLLGNSMSEILGILSPVLKTASLDQTSPLRYKKLAKQLRQSLELALGRLENQPIYSLIQGPKALQEFSREPFYTTLQNLYTANSVSRTPGKEYDDKDLFQEFYGLVTVCDAEASLFQKLHPGLYKTFLEQPDWAQTLREIWRLKASGMEACLK